MQKIANIAAYKFVTLSQLSSLRDQLQKLCDSLALKGTILLGEEGINIMLAGIKANVNKFTLDLAKYPEFTDVEYKTSYSDTLPFKRLLIKIKNEIVTFAVSGIEPQKLTGAYISPQQFKQWMDENKEMAVLDVRNECEINVGTFENAINLHIDNFRSFSTAAENLSPALKNQPLVMFCTGGIRCEKASAYLLQQGFNEVYQLHGGILQYFADVGNAHYNGKCFVFDERGAVDATLK